MWRSSPARTKDYLHISLSTLREWAGKSMLLTRIRIGSFLPAPADRADLLFYWVSVAWGAKLSSRSCMGCRALIKSCFFWIKSSAKRAFGECLGSKRRWKTWYSAISHGELRISFDPWISEWGNPPDTVLFILPTTLVVWGSSSSSWIGGRTK